MSKNSDKSYDVSESCVLNILLIDIDESHVFHFGRALSGQPLMLYSNFLYLNSFFNSSSSVAQLIGCGE